jgi:hypothetical protein
MLRYRGLVSLVASVAATACAGAGTAPVLAFGPTAGPLRYQLENYGVLDIDTPMGSQRSVDTLRATVRLEVGDPVGDGWNVSAVFEALTGSSGGDMGRQVVEGGELIGKEFRGSLSQDGAIEVDDAPPTPASLAESMDPSSILAELLGPLPTDPEATEPWPVRLVVTSQTALTITATYEGTARLAGDTIWNGRPARVILSEGTYVAEGSGMPPGAPSEIEMVMSGTSTRRYIWDAARSVMLASEISVEIDGPITLLGMNMSLDATATSRQVVRLVP